MNDLELFESLLTCETVEELHDTAKRISEQMGFEHFLYGVYVYTSLTRPYLFVLSGYPKEWRSRYDEANYAKIDPAVQHCTKTVIPAIWDDKFFAGKLGGQFRGESKEFGLASGASFSVHGGHGEAAMLSLATSRDSREAKNDVIANAGKAQLFTCYLHEAVQRIVLSKGPLPLQQASLSAREKECLLWAAEGKSSWEISNILQVSHNTVEFHLKNVTRKMGVNNRRHAVSRAVSMGLISP